MIDSTLPLPKHIAVIMDGNGRWAELRGRERLYGHVKGAQASKKLVEQAAEIGIQHLTLYAFSSENWSRPQVEISFLMKLLLKYIKKERNNLVENNIKFLCIGQKERLSKIIQQEVKKTEELTENNTGMTLTFCLSYGGRQEITEAMRSLAIKVQKKQLNPADITENLIEKELSSYPIPDPDLLIRTSGEQRLSNFLPWQMTYTELYFTDTYWPDFDSKAFKDAIDYYCKRDRRFGTVVHKSDQQGNNNYNGDKSVENAKSSLGHSMMAQPHEIPSPTTLN